MQSEINKDIYSIYRCLDTGISAIPLLHQFAFHELDLIHGGTSSNHTADNRVFDPAHFCLS